MTAESISADHRARAKRCGEAFDLLRAELGKVLVGQHQAIEQVLVAILARGHAVLEGAAGIAKGLLVSSIAEAAGLSFRRIQLTPDLAPGDLLGAEVLREDAETGRRGHHFSPGPIFANMIVADDINCTPPKTQAALLDAMHERQIVVSGKAERLPDPHFVLATQNSLEPDADYPLPESQLDKFLLFITADYPGGAEEWEMARRVTTGRQGKIAVILSGQQILEFQQWVGDAPLDDQVLGYAWRLVRASRPGTHDSLDFVDRWVARGAGPRGLLALVTCAKARALLHGRAAAGVDDVQAIVRPVLRHRIAGNHGAEANNLTSDRLIEMLLEAIPSDQVFEPPDAAS
jgi:MoxR-like ATPase